MNHLKLLFAAAAAAVAFSASAHDGHEPGKEKQAVLQHHVLPDMPGKIGIMATVQYAPGQASIPHEHPGSVFAYVLEGEVISQLEGQAPVTYKAGESWYEAPHAGHLISKNASNTKPATLVVFLLATDGEPILKPR